MKFDLDRDEAQRQFLADVWGVKLQDAPSKASKSEPGQKRTMTREDIMRNYAR